MSAMMRLDALDGVERAAVESCSECEAERTPRAYICTYHEGWMDGRAQCEPLLGVIRAAGEALRQSWPGLSGESYDRPISVVHANVSAALAAIDGLPDNVLTA
jgi:hypothetical protein